MVYCYVEEWRTIEILSNFQGSNRVKLLINKKKCNLINILIVYDILNGLSLHGHYLNSTDQIIHLFDDLLIHFIALFMEESISPQIVPDEFSGQEDDLHAEGG